MIALPWCGDYATACLEMNGHIAQRYPGDPDVLDSLTIKVVPCEVKGSGKKGQALVAWPTDQGAKGDNLLVVYFGDHPAPVER